MKKHKVKQLQCHKWLRVTKRHIHEFIKWTRLDGFDIHAKTHLKTAIGNLLFLATSKRVGWQ